MNKDNNVITQHDFNMWFLSLPPDRQAMIRRAILAKAKALKENSDAGKLLDQHLRESE